jgi:hypothetical protein
MPPRQTKYRERLKILRKEAQRGSTTAMQELYKRYHINKIMINGELVNLKDRFTGWPAKL